MIITNALYGIQYVLLNAWAGVVCSSIGILRSIVYYYYERKNKKKPVFVLLILLGFLIGFDILFYQDWFSLLPLVGTIAFTWTLWLSDTKYFRKAALIDPVMYSMYDIHVRAYADLPGVLIEFIGAVIAFVRLDVLKKGTKEKKDE